MLVLNECRISNGKLIIEASVDSLRYYDRVYISDIIIDTDKTWSANGPSSNPVYKESFEPNKCCKEECPCNSTTENKNIRMSLTARDLGVSSLDDNIFFVYIIASGYPDMDTPCGMDNSLITGVALNLRPIYNYAMGFIKEVGNSCDVPKGFIDAFLKYKSLELALKTGNYPEAFRMWKYLHGSGNIITSKGCGCNGKY